ncbi:7,8-dihydro-8-oxoguanine triphosphatase-like isoform X2 [Stegodyphus dumicola]|uniref:7,8-dihydro-8-oxoguanine triphosphatase-like isoform X2 n=1 Tax=Stegodyphus dumicola TaxID=202533 RepID=UPI0015AB2EBA|nr:7,8-dihydro-8-oxoguanine triphosphatase-like isoform X2 [Stegodyphus dumicola]
MISTKISSLVLLRKDGNILLGLKKRGFGAGKWNGFGGKIQEGESILECAKRELLEESGIYADHLDNVGYLEFEFIQNPLIMQVHVFTSSTFKGQLQETEVKAQSLSRHLHFPSSNCIVLDFCQVFAED